MLSNLGIFPSKRRTHTKIFRKLDNSLVTNCLTNSTINTSPPIAQPTRPKTCPTASPLARSMEKSKWPWLRHSCLLAGNPTSLKRPSTPPFSSMSNLTRISKELVKRLSQSSMKPTCLDQTFWTPLMRMNSPQIISASYSSIRRLLHSYPP